jgi:excisionase family DNA binding protein
MTSPPPVKLLLTPKEAAQALNISPRKLWELSARKQIPVVRIGRSTRYDPVDLARYIQAQKKGGAL